MNAKLKIILGVLAAIGAFLAGIFTSRTFNRSGALDSPAGAVDSDVDKLRQSTDSDRCRVVENGASLEQRESNIAKRQGDIDSGSSATGRGRDIIKNTRENNRDIIDGYKSGEDKPSG